MPETTAYGRSTEGFISPYGCMRGVCRQYPKAAELEAIEAIRNWTSGPEQHKGRGSRPRNTRYGGCYVGNYQKLCGAGGWSRTTDKAIMSRLLYH
jgi:hypothetical protein